MSEIKDVYVIEWMGPYDSLDEMYEREGIESCRIYLVVPQKAENSLILINKRSLFLSMFTVFIIFA